MLIRVIGTAAFLEGTLVLSGRPHNVSGAKRAPYFGSRKCHKRFGGITKWPREVLLFPAIAHAERWRH